MEAEVLQRTRRRVVPSLLLMLDNTTTTTTNGVNGNAGNASPPDSPGAQPPQDLWSSILDSVSTSRSIPSKNVLILGGPQSGKSTLATALLGQPAARDSDFALGYDWADVRDDAEEDTLARLSVYTVPSHSYTRLLPDFLPPKLSISNSLAVIVLDWTRPWTFIEELELWLGWIKLWVEQDDSREAEIAREECRERLQHYLQHYTEPSAESELAPSSLSNTATLPLGPGTFTHNSAGIPIVVVCTKADLIDEGNDIAAGAGGMGSMVKGTGGLWEERTDGIMQVLRTICLKYGAALFYTTQQPATLHILRQYILHMLFIPPAPAAPGAESVAVTRNPFAFPYKPNTLDRDHIMVPTGWDSWGMIRILREGFDAKKWGEAWEHDMDSSTGDDGNNNNSPGAADLYKNLVPDQGVKPPPLPAFNNPTLEQTFLAKHYEENSKKPDRDPRAAFRAAASDMPISTAGVVGPLGGFNIPGVERAFAELDSNSANPLSASTSTLPSAAGGAGAGGAGRPPARGATGRPSALLGGAGAGASAGAAGARGVAASPTVPVAPSPTSGGQTQHEVLQNFFQSLLSNKDRSAAAGVGQPSPRTPVKTNGNAGAGDSSFTEDSLQ